MIRELVFGVGVDHFFAARVLVLTLAGEGGGEGKEEGEEAKLHGHVDLGVLPGQRLPRLPEGGKRKRRRVFLGTARLVTRL